MPRLPLVIHTARRASMTTFVVLSCLSTCARADEFSDFRIPRHTLRSVIADLSGAGSRLSEEGIGFTRRAGSLEGETTVSGTWLLDSDPLRIFVSADGKVDGRTNHSNTRQTISNAGFSNDVQNHERSRLTGEEADLRFGVRQYPWAIPVGWDLGFATLNDYQQGWERSKLENTVAPPPVTSTAILSRGLWQFSNQVVGSVALGIGRVRDATALYDARVLEQRLLRTGTIAHRLSTRAIERLATLFYADDYGAVHDRPAKYAWRDVETILRDDGALAEGGLDAYGLMKIQESPLPDGPRVRAVRTAFVRQVGCFAGIQFSANYLNGGGHRRLAISDGDSFGNVFEYHEAQEFHHEQKHVFVGTQAELHRPVGLRWQLDASGAAGRSINPDSHDLSAHSSFGTSYLLLERLWGSGNVSWTWSRFRNGDRRTRHAWSVFSTAALAYDVEDHVQAYVRLDDLQDGGFGYDAGQRLHSQHQEQVWLGLTYRFLGVLDIPGVTGPAGFASTR